HHPIGRPHQSRHQCARGREDVPADVTGASARRANQFVLSEVLSSPCCKNILLPVFGNIWFSQRIPPPSRGASRPSRTLEAGSGGRAGLRETNASPARTAKACGPVPPMLGSSSQAILR